MHIFSYIVTIVGVVMSFGYYPQAWEIWKNKSSQNVSLVNYIILSIGTATWFSYGVVLRDPVIITSFAVGVVGSWLVLYLLLTYRHR